MENGSTDHTLEFAKEFALNHPNFLVYQEQQRGKGNAVQQGMLKARGQYRFICDADLSMPIEEIQKFLPPALTDFDIAIGLPKRRMAKVLGVAYNTLDRFIERNNLMPAK